MSVRSFSKFLASLSMFACTSLFAAPLVVDVTGIKSFGEFGDANNTVLTYNVGANATITSVSLAVNLTAFSPSWLYDFGLAMSDSAVFDGAILYPSEDQFAGTRSYTQFYDMVAAGLSFNVGADGILRLEFFEDFDDLAGVDGVWNFGTITIGVDGGIVVPPTNPVPEPASVLLLASGLVALGYTRRRRATAAA
jgi:hypothetical protein